MGNRARRKVKRRSILRPYFTTRNGKRIYARDYGYQAWPIGRQ